MIDASRKIVSFAADIERQQFDQDEMRQLALLRLIEIVGEAASRISVEMQTEHPEIPWAAITGMRNRLVHAYFAVDLDRVWATITISIPALLAQLEAIQLPKDKNET